MGETEKNLQAALSKLSEISKKGFGLAKESITQSSHAVKVRLDITILKKERKRLSTDLGDEVFTAIKAGKLKSKLFDDLVNNLKEIDVKIEKKSKELGETDEKTSGENNADNLSETAAVKDEEKEKTEE